MQCLGSAFLVWLCLEWYVALYAYSSMESGDLTFNAGDVINVISAEGDWWKGILNGRMGDFPGSYVKKYDASASLVRIPLIYFLSNLLN